MTSKERVEGKQSQIFINLFNKKYGTDYQIGPIEEENSIIDRKAISQSGKWREMILQLKEVRELDRSYLTKSIMGEDVNVFDLNIFKLLTPLLKKTEKKYGKAAKDVILIFNVGVSESWVRDYIVPEFIRNTNFKGIYCFALPPEEYIFPLKETDIRSNKVSPKAKLH